PGAEAPPGGDPQGPREFSLPAELRGGGSHRARPRLARRRAAGADRALDRRHQRGRSGGRRFSGLARRADRARPDQRAGRPPRRVHPRGLPAFPPLLCREECAGGAPGAESFLALVRRQILTRAQGDSPYGIEAEARPPIDGLIEAGIRLAAGFDRLAVALRRLSSALRRQLEDPDNPPEPGLRQRLEAAVRGLERRADMQLASWSALLRDLAEPPGPDTVEWLALDR